MFNSLKILFFLYVFSTLLFSAKNTVQKVILQKDKIHITFSKKFDEKYVRHFILHHPKRYVYDLKNTRLKSPSLARLKIDDVRMSQYKKNIVRIVITAKGRKSVAYQPLFFDNKYYIGLGSNKKKKMPVKEKPQAKKIISEEKEDSPLGFSLSFFEDAFGGGSGNSHKSELIVIDAGHGGHDSGAVGGGKLEKDLVLMIAKKVEKSLKNRGHPVYMTRRTDKFLTLKERTRFADKKEAVVFVSIHANSVPKKKRHRVYGIETYFLQKTRDAKSQRIAARENKSVLQGTNKLSRNVIIDSVINGPKIVESNKLAIDVQRSMIKKLKKSYRKIKDNGVKHAPFWVLVGASRPSILVEVGYISHAGERKKLFTASYQNTLSKAIADGIDNYLNHRKKEIDFY
ncbi:N-acetylmuramoyl-L-alanine amidase [hydrothermal vent metagenome]|uniref:N-acetylmuramoyl-L-alanine amidase n=1 Tax=hydrothermal vent metagenome TaxID=652676 RepID=A0A1W1CQV4_9ZZZZ